MPSFMPRTARYGYRAISPLDPVIQYIPPFSPLSIPGLQLWLKADAGLTLSTTGYAGTGTTVAQSGNTLTGVSTKFRYSVQGAVPA